MIEKLKPSVRLLVYDLVREAGIDVSDWANYKRFESPASNPRYCYEWAFEGAALVVLCLWHTEIQQSGSTIFQELNYRTASTEHRHWSANQKERSWRMDHAIRKAFIGKLPIRVIIVDGSRRGDDEKGASRVERRMLDPQPWVVASYDDEIGNARIERSEGVMPSGTPKTETNLEGTDRLTRIAYNSSGWQHPTGEAGAQESGETYNAQNKFGHEDWLFRAEWVLDGWRYAFIQGLNKGRESYLGQSLNITLYTIQPDKRRRLVATIYGLESLSDEQANDALKTFRDRGWLKTMQEEVRAIGGKAEALGAPEWAPHVLNVRFRQNGVDLHPTETFLADDEWLQNRHRYMLYKLDGPDRTRIEQTHIARRGTQTAPNANLLFRRGTKSMCYTPEHARMQTKLLAELQSEYGKEHVWLETDYVDVRVETVKELILFEIKSDLDPRAVIRQALGQILEYAYHPMQEGRRPDRLVIVGRMALGAEDTAYLILSDITTLKGESVEQLGYGLTIEWIEINTAKYGRNTVPADISLATEADFLGYVGKRDEVRTIRIAAETLVQAFPDLQPQLPGLWRLLRNGSREFWQQVVRVVSFFRDFPFPDRYVRELPVEVHTKFIGENAVVLERLIGAAAPHALRPDGETFEERLGLKTPDALIECRLLDDALLPGWRFRQFTVGLKDLNHLGELPAHTILITENRTNFLTLPLTAGTIALQGQGYAVSRLRRAPFLETKHIIYWGDLDAQGFEILAVLRRTFPQTESLMMDMQTWTRFAGYQVDGVKSRNQAEQFLPYLREEEATLFSVISSLDKRLEQEKIPQDYVNEKVTTTACQRE